MKKLLLSVVSTSIFLFSSPVFAHEEANNIAVVDFQKVFVESAVGKDVTAKLEAQRKKFEDSRNKKEAELVKTNEDLKKQQSILATEAFEKKRKDFEEKVQAFQQDLQTDSAKFEKMRNTALEHIENAAREITSDLAKEKHLKLVVAQNVALFAADDINLTSEVLKRLDKKLKSIDLK